MINSLTIEQNIDINTVKVFAEVLLWDDEICRRVVLDKKCCRDQTFDLPTLVFYKTFPCVSCQDKNTTLLLEENKKGLLY